MGFEISMLFMAAFSGSLAHCIGMCGGIVLSCNMRKFNNSTILQILSNVVYFFGRSTSYIAIGICFSLISVNLGFSNASRAIIFIILGILLFITALLITFFPKFLINITPSGNYKWYKRAFQKAIQSKSIFSFFIIGILNGLLPCHLVYIFAIKAADAMNIWYAILTMAIFSLGTFLPLFLVGIFSASLLHSKARNILLKISFLIMSYFAFSNIYKGVSYFISPEANSHSKHEMHINDNRNTHHTKQQDSMKHNEYHNIHSSH
ncbi:hypothetical protein CQA53_02370 [Helicobacter didelphidarum]|uniref:Urease accessory protein UreH-like transmembrane domain-containing protein n=1 Tax=Helicobacter didelphidarum TaxID=2040648 RepID=A0A3D8IPC9_9HELI|nr:sulfite exporter TauE/SafE family protein [Helicobacter didelphidarum]RDU67118.1 hypothetical protein CQA53_02370 [Helicobacter didelphidarum]